MTGRRPFFLFAAAAVALLCAAAFAACGSSGSSGSPPEVLDPTGQPAAAVSSAAAQLDLKPGTAATVPVEEGTVRVTVRSMKTRTTRCSADWDPPENGTFVIADVLVEVTAGTFSFSGGEFQWVADDGTTADTVGASGCGTSSLRGTNGLPAGQKRAGQIVFDIPSAKGSLGFVPDLSGPPVASWRS